MYLNLPLNQKLVIRDPKTNNEPKESPEPKMDPKWPPGPKWIQSASRTQNGPEVTQKP